MATCSKLCSSVSAWLGVFVRIVMSSAVVSVSNCFLQSTFCFISLQLCPFIKDCGIYPTSHGAGKSKKVQFKEGTLQEDKNQRVQC